MIHGHGDDLFNYPGIRCNFSSNIYGHADMTALKAHLCRHIHLIGNYPEPSPRSLEMAIASKYGVSAENILVTNGATDAIYLIAQTFARKGCVHDDIGELPTFCEYEDACRMAGLTRWSGGEEDGVPASAVLRWVCNPNNPTGDVYTREEVEKLAQRYGIVVIDQSYEDFTLAPVMTHQEAADSNNIIQIHSLTKKYAIPGLRVGYVVASRHLIRLLRENVRPWSVNALAVEAGKWLMENDVSGFPSLSAYLGETKRLSRMLSQIPGVTVHPTHTHFFLAETEKGMAALLKDYLAKNHHLLIRDASNFQGLTPRHFRVSTQSPEENDWLVAAIREYAEDDGQR